MQLRKIVVLSVVFLLLASLAMAEIVKQQGVGQITYKGWGGPSSTVKQEAVEKAKKSAIEKYSASFSTAKTMNYEKIRNKIESDLDRYIVEYRVIDDDTDKGSKRYSVVIDASINASLIEVELQKVSAIQNTASDEQSSLSFVFVARKVVSQKTFDSKRSKRVVEESSTEESEEAHVDGEQMSYSSETYKGSVKKTGGSTVQKSDQIEYDVSTVKEINATMSGIFSSAGYEVIPAVYLKEDSGGLILVEDYINDYADKNEISADTVRNTAKGCRNAKIDYFATGTLDIGAKSIDPVSGFIRVYVSVNGEIMDMQNRYPKTVASVGPVQYAGIGPDQTVATNNALRLAGENAAKDLTSKLRAKNIK